MKNAIITLLTAVIGKNILLPEVGLFGQVFMFAMIYLFLLETVEVVNDLRKG